MEPPRAFAADVPTRSERSSGYEYIRKLFKKSKDKDHFWIGSPGSVCELLPFGQSAPPSRGSVGLHACGR